MASHFLRRYIYNIYATETIIMTGTEPGSLGTLLMVKVPALMTSESYILSRPSLTRILGSLKVVLSETTEI